jgi:hypothetical protein
MASLADGKRFPNEPTLPVSLLDLDLYKVRDELAWAGRNTRTWRDVLTWSCSSS